MSQGIVIEPPIDELRAAALRADVGNGVGSVVLAKLWHELVAGTYRIVDCFFTTERCYMVMSRASRENANALQGRRRVILEQFLAGSPQKVIADDLEVSISTVAATLRQCFKHFGLDCVGSRAPLLLVLAATAAARSNFESSLRSSSFCLENRFYAAASVERPDARLARLLSGAEYEVARLRVEGRTYAEIASLRRTSQRTVANQLAAVFHRLHTSGRSELLQLLSA
jgi:DNA-binding NarL/FixJ family response regulator